MGRGNSFGFRVFIQNKALFVYRSNDPTKADSDLMAIRDNRTGSVTYQYYAKDSTGNTTHVHAYDFDGDGNIDKFTYADRTDNKGKDRETVGFLRLYRLAIVTIDF
ncbi:hypothetical protein J6I39_02415 [bacterium]|nr:hypothetical protein [bacterium]